MRWRRSDVLFARVAGGRNEPALMLIGGRTAPALTVVRSASLDVDGWARDSVIASLLDDFNVMSG